MKGELELDIVEGHEAIRQAAFALACSGVCDGWQAVWHALHTRFSADQLTAIFDSPFCRLDLDLRCDHARRPARVVDCQVTAYPHVIRRNGLQAPVTWTQPVVRPKSRPGGLLGERIRALLIDGRARTALELAQELDANRNEVLRALRPLLTEETVEVTRFIVGSCGGRAARAFTCAGMATSQHNGDARSHAAWPHADPVVISAIDAIARNR
ncbi:hypothetical protein [Paraburkholderia terrae]